MNAVIAGNYINGQVKMKHGEVIISKIGMKPIILNNSTVEDYEVINSESDKTTFSAGGAIAGDLLFGPLGALLGGTSTKLGMTLIALELKSGDKCLIEVNKTMYTELMKKLFKFTENTLDSETYWEKGKRERALIKEEFYNSEGMNYLKETKTKVMSFINNIKK